MNILQNAWAYVSRKKFKTLIIFFILFSMATVALSSLAVKHATDTAAKETFKSINSSFSMQIDRRHNQGTARGGGNLKGKDIQAIEGIEGVQKAVKRMEVVADLVDQELIPAKGVRLDATRQQRFGKAAQVTGINDSSMDERFAAQTFTLTEGRHIKDDDTNVALVHEDFAKKNNLKVGDKFKLKSNIYDADNEKHANNQTEVTIVGLFGGKNKGGVTAPQELYENTILTDLKTSALMYGYTDADAIYLDATFLVGGQYDIDKVMEQAKKLGIDWKAYTLIKSSQNYPTLQKSINLVYGLTDKLFLGSLIFSAIILVLVLFLWTNSRRREIGVRLALGMTNKTIIAQMLCEVGMVSIASFIAAILAGGPVSEWVGKLILGQVNSSLGTQLANEAKSANLGGGAAVDGFNKTLTELSVTVSNIDKATVVGLGLVVIVIAVLLGSAFILQKSPKSLLQDTE